MRWSWPSSPKVPWMTLKASSVPGGTTKSGPRTSTAVTAAPSSRNAATTPSPDLSDTGRSEPGPPISTAMGLLRRSIMGKNGDCLIVEAAGFADDLDLGFQGDAALLERRFTHLRDEI